MNFNRPYFMMGMEEDVDDINDYCGPPGPAPGPMRRFRGPRFGRNNDWRGEAFGDYQGGYGRREPPPLMGPRFAPVEHPNIKYLIRCDIPRNFVYNLPGPALEMMNPHYCGICDVNFDSFVTSRGHYNSKGHYKRQKKFINTLDSPTMSLNNKSMRNVSNIEGGPIKSRDLYCELCNVQITSRVHADSHYAGKSHRSIVEGKKPPKNPTLLSMHARLQSLIRREKKHLKAVVPEPAPAVTETAAPEPPKPLDPTLYCDICQTSVTCTEQMRMHKNGKKHLSKEKRHIFLMMKGQREGGTKDNAQPANGNGADATGDDEPEEVPGEAEESKVDAEQWGQGGGEHWDASEM